MRAGHLRRFALAGLAAAFLSVAGCAYTTVTVTSPKPKLGPLVSTGLAAAMPPVKDTRQWPGMDRDQPIAEVRIFEPQITQTLREGLVKNHLFAALPAPSQPEAAELTDRLDVVLTAFRMDKVNTNLWVVPHLILDGVALPAFAATTVVSKGQVDMGGYLLPSTAMGVTLQAKVFLFGEKNLKVMERPYLVELPLGSVSERELRESLRSSAGYGVRLGREEGQKVLAKFVETVSRDPYWAYVEDFRQLAEAEALVASREAPMVEKMAAARRVLRLLKPLIYTPEEGSVLRDGSLKVEVRIKVVNDIRARRLGVEVKDLPPEQAVAEDDILRLFDDPGVARGMVEGAMAQRVLALAGKLMAPPLPRAPVPVQLDAVTAASSAPTGLVRDPARTPATRGYVQVGPASPPLIKARTPTLASNLPRPPLEIDPVGTGANLDQTPPPRLEVDPAADQAAIPPRPAATTDAIGAPVGNVLAVAPDAARTAAQRRELALAVAAAVKGNPVLQWLLLEESEKAVGPNWPLMATLLRSVGDPLTQAYLVRREGLGS